MKRSMPLICISLNEIVTFKKIRDEQDERFGAASVFPPILQRRTTAKILTGKLSVGSFSRSYISLCHRSNMRCANLSFLLVIQLPGCFSCRFNRCEAMIESRQRNARQDCRRSNQNRPVRVELKPASFSLQICCAILRS
jgi:hypothetical protein